MSRLAELRHESDQISARTKAMLEQFPGNKWGGTQESEWAGLMARAGEVHAEITSLQAANEQAGRDWTNEEGGRVRYCATLQTSAPTTPTCKAAPPAMVSRSRLATSCAAWLA